MAVTYKRKVCISCGKTWSDGIKMSQHDDDEGEDASSIKLIIVEVFKKGQLITSEVKCADCEESWFYEDFQLDQKVILKAYSKHREDEHDWDQVLPCCACSAIFKDYVMLHAHLKSFIN